MAAQPPPLTVQPSDIIATETHVEVKRLPIGDIGDVLQDHTLLGILFGVSALVTKLEIHSLVFESPNFKLISHNEACELL